MKALQMFAVEVAKIAPETRRACDILVLTVDTLEELRTRPRPLTTEEGDALLESQKLIRDVSSMLLRHLVEAGFMTHDEVRHIAATWANGGFPQ
jgi:hypothetical protein